MQIDRSWIASFVRHYGLTKRQEEVLRAFADDPQATSESIAPKIGCSPSTINVHLSKILEKTGLKNKRDLLTHLSQQVDPNVKTEDSIRPLVILVVDDDPVFRNKVLTSIHQIAAGRALTIECENGMSAMMHLSRAKRHDPGFLLPDIILLDLLMPQMTGMKALEKIKSDPDLKQVAVIVFSSQAEKDTINSTYSLGSNSFIFKPTQDAEIHRVVQLILQYWGNFGSAALK